MRGLADIIKDNEDKVLLDYRRAVVAGRTDLSSEIYNNPSNARLKPRFDRMAQLIKEGTVS